METKKRPNDDSQEQAENSSAGLAVSYTAHSTTQNADDALSMDVDSTKLEAPSTAVDSMSSTDAHRHIESHQSTGEANKRLKMTMEAEISGIGYSPSVDVVDPSKETKGFAEWVEKMDEDGKMKDTTDLGHSEGPQLPAAVTSAGVSDPNAIASRDLKVDTELVEQINGDGKPKEEHSDDVDQKLPPADAPSVNVNHGSELSNPESNIQVKSSSNEEGHAESRNATDEDSAQGLAAADAGPTVAELSDSILAVSSLSEPLMTTLEVLEDDSALDNGKEEEPPAITQGATENGSNSTNKEATSNSTELPRIVESAPSNPSVGADKPTLVHSLPAFSSLSAAQIEIDLPQNARPSRSTMSVSALLLNNDDDSELELEHGKRTSRNLFDQFEAPLPNPSPPSPQSAPEAPRITAPSSMLPIHTLQPSQSHATSSASQPVQTSGQPSASSISPRSVGGAHRIRDPAETASVQQTHSGFNRAAPENNQLAGNSQDSTRATTGKEYSADEVMESGGVSGYGSQRHSLASTIGIRPLPEPVNGMGGTTPMNGKLPGLGSVASVSHAHQHDPHAHPSSYRSDSQHSPMTGRPNSYSPNQHSTMAHQIAVNGHMHYPSNGHQGHTPGMPSSTPLPPLTSAAVNHHPRLIVKNDPNLKMDGRPELFLGYYRYDPTLLLPTLEGKENSVLEVRIASSYLTYDNAKVKKRELWGTDIYTDDSDVVAMLIHGGFFIPPVSAHSGEQDSLQPTSQQHNFVQDPIKHICPGYDLAVTLRVVPKLIKYQGSIRHRIKSRTWNTGHDGVSLKVESIRKLCPGEALNRGRSQSKRRMREYSQERLRVLANIHDENTESLQNERAMRTATFEFTHQGDPCFKYSPELVMDRHDGLSRKWTSWRLKKEVLILENDEERYEISLQHHAGTNARRFDQYRFAVISPRTSLSSWSKASYPLESTNLTEVLYEDLDWQDFEWVERGVVVQPSQRAKQSMVQSNSSPLMEGVEPTGESPQHPVRTRPTIDTSKPTSETTMLMDAEDAVTNDMARDSIGTESSNAALSGPSGSGSLEAQQDGVFCVVSRLFWRPITEPRSTDLPGAVSSSPSTDSRLTKDADKTISAESHSQHDLKGLAPAAMPTSSTTRPLLEQVVSGTNTDLKHRPISALSTDVAERNDAIEPVSVISQAPVISYPAQLHASSVPNTGASDMEVDIGVNKPASTAFGEQPPHGPRQAEATAPVPDFNLAEHEDGELEEGEITSD